jgi:hypothetical protein
LFQPAGRALLNFVLVRFLSRQRSCRAFEICGGNIHAVFVKPKSPTFYTPLSELIRLLAALQVSLWVYRQSLLGGGNRSIMF